MLAWREVGDPVRAKKSTVKAERINARAADKDVVTGAAIDDVVAITAEQRVVACPAKDAVDAVKAIEFIVSGIAEQ